jgi:DNA-binding MarR family transcriptional regulator
MKDGTWHLSSELAKDLNVHTTTVSKFLHHLADLHLVERRPHDSRTYEYRLPSTQLSLEVDLADESGPLREAIDFYVTYFQTLFDRIRRLGWASVEAEMQHRLTVDHEELRAAIFQNVIAGDDEGVGRLRELVAAVHRDIWAVCSKALGASAAERVFQGALREAVEAYPDLATRCGLARPLGG